jgi:hypothetical protein
MPQVGYIIAGALACVGGAFVSLVAWALAKAADGPAPSPLDR